MQSSSQHINQKTTGPALKGDESIYYTLKEACAYLGICEATGRNWISNGRLHTKQETGKRIQLSIKEVHRLKTSLQKGSVSHLRTRRNKIHKKGFLMPVGYLSQKTYEKQVKILAQTLEQHSLEPFEIGLILAEQAIRLFQGRELIPPMIGEESRVVAYLQGILSLGQLEPLILDLIPKVDIHEIKEPFINTFLLFQVPPCWDEDYLGLLYTVLQCVGKRKAEGIYYTPFNAVRSALKVLATSVPDALTESILDPCCGTGQFLLQAFKDKWAAGLFTDADMDRYLDIFGFDSDSTSIQLARINMVLISGVIKLEALYAQFRIQDTLEDHEDEKYGCIIGNPPWGYTYTQAQIRGLRKNYTLAESTRVESYGLFIEWAVAHIKPNGHITYILPEGVLSIKYHEHIRRLIRKTVNIHGVYFLENAFDGVFMPSIALVLKNDIFRAAQVPIHGYQKNNYYKIELDRWSEDDRLNLRATDEIYKRLKNMNDMGCYRLKDNADFAMGIVTGDNKAFVLKRNSKDAEPLLTGKDVQAYTMGKARFYIQGHTQNFQQMAPLELYRAPEKLVYRFIADRLIVAYDDTRSLTLNSCNCILPRLEGYSMKVILSLLNSEALKFYYQNTYSAMKVLKEYLESLPIPLLTDKDKNELETLCDSRIKTSHVLKAEKLQKQMDDIIWNAFGMKPFESEKIQVESSKGV